MLVIPRCPYSYFFSSNCFLCDQDVSRTDGFSLEVDYFFLIIMKYIFSSDLASWLASSGRIATNIDISRYSNSSLSKTTALSSSIKVWFHGFIPLGVRWLLFWTIIYLVSYVVILIGRESEKVQLMFFICRFSSSIFSTTTVWNFSNKVSVETLLSIMVFFWKWFAVRLIGFFEPHWRRISQCDCASCWKFAQLKFLFLVEYQNYLHVFLIWLANLAIVLSKNSTFVSVLSSCRTWQRFWPSIPQFCLDASMELAMLSTSAIGAWVAFLDSALSAVIPSDSVPCSKLPIRLVSPL